MANKLRLKVKLKAMQAIMYYHCKRRINELKN